MPDSVMIFTPSYKNGNVDQARKRMLASRERVVAQAEKAGLRCEVVHSYVNPYRTGNLENVLAQYQHFRKLFLDSDHEAALLFEYDIIAPDNRLVELYKMQVPVACGVYLFRHVAPVLNICRYVKASYPTAASRCTWMSLTKR